MTRLRAVWHRLLHGHTRRPLFGQPEVCSTCEWMRFPYSEYRRPDVSGDRRIGGDGF